MKLKSWHILASAVFLLSVISFLFFFPEEKTNPSIGSVPYIFWSSFVITVFVVLATFIGSIIFPQEDSPKS
jgi:RsiW-degrading membrane proteinase PrsW (M82 family)